MQTRARRHFLKQALGWTPVLWIAPTIAQYARAAESCVESASESLRGSLHYQATSSDPQKPCSKCGFFTSGDAKGCGDCQILSGPVDAGGHCDSWSAKS
jgi:hypothetical protein